MLNQRINFYYYSGTGNTLLVVKEMTNLFLSKGIKVNLHKIENTDPSEIAVDSTIGLAFPVAFQSTFPFLWHFFKAFPSVTDTPVFMVDTMMSFSGAIVGPLKQIFKRKGYKCIGAREIVMPSNWFPKKINMTKNKNIVAKGLGKARNYANDLIEGKTSWNRIPFLSKGFYYTCCNDFLMNSVNLSSGRKIKIDIEKCTKCGLCVKLCPKENILMKNYPQWNKSCELCMRCLCFCPSGAVYIPEKKFERYQAVKANELLKAIKISC
jgi:ferredoxin